jgi:catechol 2,3-dioxygenase-like lactoylglutathione lyase family enzyme
MRHTGIVVPDIGASGSLWADDGGLATPYGLRAVPALELIQSMMPVDVDAAIELIQPLTRDGLVSDSLTSGRGLFHVSFVVPDLDLAVEQASAAGCVVVRLPATRTYPAPYVFIDAMSAHGAWIELMEVREGSQVPVAGDPNALIKSLDHIGHAVDDVALAATFYVDALGMTLDPPVSGSQRHATVVADRGPALRLIPRQGWSAPTDHIAGNAGAGLAYIACVVDDLDVSVARLRAQGYWLSVGEDPADGRKAVWVVPRPVGSLVGPSLGALLLLVQPA